MAGLTSHVIPGWENKKPDAFNVAEERTAFVDPNKNTVNVAAVVVALPKGLAKTAWYDAVVRTSGVKVSFTAREF